MGRQKNIIVHADDPLFSCWLKINRAKKHFNDLNAEAEAFKARNPYRIIVEADSESRTEIYKLQITEQIPLEWSGHVGDIVHNLRSALDTLAVALVKRGIGEAAVTQNVMEETYFPVHWTKGQLSKGKSQIFFERVGPDVEKFIRRLEPYRGGKGDAIFRLHQLDTMDKHRAIVPVGSSLPKIQIKFPTPIFPDQDPASAPMLPPIEFDTADRLYPLKDGDVLFRSEAADPQFQAHAINFTFEIAFGEGQFVDGEPLVPTLSQGIKFVQRLIFIFRQRFFRV